MYILYNYKYIVLYHITLLCTSSKINMEKIVIILLKQHSIIEGLNAENFKLINFHVHLLAVYNADTMNIIYVRRYVLRDKPLDKSKINVYYCSRIVTDEHYQARLDKIIHNNRCVKQYEIAT